MRNIKAGNCILAAIACTLYPLVATAQGRRPRPTVEGTAVVHVSERDITLPILCDERGRPEAGFVADRGPQDNRNKLPLYFSGRPGDQPGEFKLLMTSGATWGATISQWVSTAGVMKAAATLKSNERELEMDFEANCNSRAN